MNTLKTKALSLGATDLKRSTRKNKKFMVIYNGSWVHFGDSRYEDYTMHKDKKRRALYRIRHSKIIDKDGRPAYLNKNKPSYWSYNLLW